MVWLALSIADTTVQVRPIISLACMHSAEQNHSGIGIDGDSANEVVLFKQVGKVAALRKLISESSIDMQRPFVNQCSIAHTRWATHGAPSPINCHPVRSDPTNEFNVVHNGIVTNNSELRLVLQKKGYKFESETDTEAVAVLFKYVWDSQPQQRLDFSGLVKTVLKELEGSFAFVFKSVHFPNEVVTARRGSPLLIGVKTQKKLKVDFVDVEIAGPDVEKGNGLCKIHSADRILPRVDLSQYHPVLPPEVRYSCPAPDRA